MYSWLAVWNMFFSFHSVENNNPNLLSYFSEGLTPQFRQLPDVHCLICSSMAGLCPWGLVLHFTNPKKVITNPSYSNMLHEWYI